MTSNKNNNLGYFNFAFDDPVEKLLLTVFAIALNTESEHQICTSVIVLFSFDITTTRRLTTNVIHISECSLQSFHQVLWESTLNLQDKHSSL